MKNFKVSVVVAVYNEEGNVPLLTKQLTAVLKAYPDYEIIFVDDGSQDDTLAQIKKLHAQNKKVQYLALSKNCGQQYAIKAGLDAATGDCVISMDGDLQHPVSMIPKMITAWQTGNDIVYTVRADSRGETFFKRMTSKVFYKLFNFLSGLKLPAGTADFRLLDRKVVDVICALPEKKLFLRGIVFSLGFKQVALSYMPDKRHSGTSGYSFKKMLSLALAGVTSFSIKPLRLAIYMGVFVAMLGCAFTVYVLYMKLAGGAVISGWASMMSVSLILGGVQLFVMGIIGEYVGMIYTETKARPGYIVRETSIRKGKK
ncbi:MAG: glycosyltransferase family 2 protein [Lactobacillales bacterium]|jgi:dolichol-phosphate mannosyltransferase|nr:glycosyltransferase family 2 protein [Lactobacillales bacterium]